MRDNACLQHLTIISHWKQPLRLILGGASNADVSDCRRSACGIGDARTTNKAAVWDWKRSRLGVVLRSDNLTLARYASPITLERNIFGHYFPLALGVSTPRQRQIIALVLRHWSFPRNDVGGVSVVLTEKATYHSPSPLSL